MSKATDSSTTADSSIDIHNPDDADSTVIDAALDAVKRDVHCFDDDNSAADITVEIRVYSSSIDIDIMGIQTASMHCMKNSLDDVGYTIDNVLFINETSSVCYTVRQTES